MFFLQKCKYMEIKLILNVLNALGIQKNIKQAPSLYIL